MSSLSSPIATLAIKIAGKGPSFQAISEPVYGGYINGRGRIVLFGKDQAYRIDFRNQTLQLRPQLNFGAQARYDQAQAGESFEFGNKTFERLSEQQITEICDSGDFRVTPRQLCGNKTFQRLSEEAITGICAPGDLNVTPLEVLV